MKILDCETRESTFKSLETILNRSKEEITQVLFDSPTINDFSGLKLLKRFKMKDDFNLCDRVMYFHGTRTTLDAIEDIKVNGLHPLPLAVEKIWAMLELVFQDRIIDKVDWINFKDKCIKTKSTSYYNLLNNSSDANFGPWAKMIFETVVNNKAGVNSHDYLDMPEVIENIFEQSKKEFTEIDFKTEFKKVCNSYVIKFWIDEDNGEISKGRVERALIYLQKAVKNLPFGKLCDDYSAINKIITSSQIVDIFPAENNSSE